MKSQSSERNTEQRRPSNQRSSRFGVHAHDRISALTRQFACSPAMGGTTRNREAELALRLFFMGGRHKQSEFSPHRYCGFQPDDSGQRRVEFSNPREWCNRL